MPPNDDEIQPDASDLLVFIDETGHETFAGDQAYYGLGACVLPGASYPHLKEKWDDVRMVVAGSRSAPLHATSMERRQENFAALSGFFLEPAFCRVAVMTTKDVGLPEGMHPCVPVMGELRKEIAEIARLLPVRKVWIIVESSSRADPVVRECFHQLSELDPANPLPAEHVFMPKRSGEEGLEVADFIVSAAGSQIKRRMQNKAGTAPDFDHVFGRLHYAGCRYLEIAQLAVEANGRVRVDGVRWVPGQSGRASALPT